MTPTKHRSKHSAPPLPALWTRPAVWASAVVILACLVAGIWGCVSQASAADVSVAAKCRSTTVRIAAEEAGPANRTTWSFGSGVIVQRGPKVRVETAGHVIRHARRVYVGLRGVWVPVHRSRIKIDTRWDLGTLEVPEAAGLASMELAPAVQLGQRVTAAGFGSGTYQERAGIVQGWAAPATGEPWEGMIVTGPARQGDSGGPLVSDDGSLAGILQATDGRTTYGTVAARVARFIDTASVGRVPVELASLPMPSGYTQTLGRTPSRRESLAAIAKNSQPPVAPPPGPFPPSVPAPSCAPVDLGPVTAAIEAQGQQTRDAIAEAVGALSAQQAAAKPAEPEGLKGKIHAKLEADAEEGGLKGKVAEKLLRWEERGNMGLWIAIVLGIAGAVYWHKNKHGPVAGVLERFGRPELAERETDLVEKLEARVKGAVAAAATANPAVGLAVSEAEKVEQRLKDLLEARLKPAPGQQSPTPPTQA